jgi:hypothetical protein
MIFKFEDLFYILCFHCLTSSLLLHLRSLLLPNAIIFLCLWHVRKAWAENAVKKINVVVERTTVLQLLGDVMYDKGCGIDDDTIDWALA